MAERIFDTNIRLFPAYELEAPASDPEPAAEEESLASLAALSGVNLNNRSVSNFVASFNNAAIAQVQGATQ